MAQEPWLETLRNYLRHNPENATCISWIIKDSNVGGRGVFATKPIKTGDLIFINKPLVVGPRADQKKEIFCSVCYKKCDFCNCCDKCFLPVCSKDCETKQEHKRKCVFINENWKLTENCVRNPMDLGRLQIYLRSLLLTEEQMTLAFLLQKNKTNSNNDDLEELCSKYAIPEIQRQFINTMTSILNINAFRISNNTSEKTIPLRGLYPLSSFLNHNCVPNTRNVFTNDNSMAVYATRNIEIGEEIFTCYTGLLWCTPARRCQLFKTKKFWCKCDRCKDTTEMGTRLSALKCSNKGCVGVLLPAMPLDPRTDWRCDNCGANETAEKVNNVQSMLGSLVGTLDLDDQFRLESFVLERLAIFIPYSSHIFVDLRLRLALKLGFAESSKLKELSEARVALKENLCRGTLRTVAALGVGDAHLRGLLLYHLHAALAERARRSPDLYEELKSEIESTIEQAYHILQGDVSAPPDLELRRKYLGPGSDKTHEERFFMLDS